MEVTDMSHAMTVVVGASGKTGRRVMQRLQARGVPAYVPVSMEDTVAAAAEEEVPDDGIWLLRYLFTEVLDGRNAHVSDGVQRALGREPRDFAVFAREAAARAVWEG
jgi:nucleoside-diphosphate-sugar epimerase